MLQRFFFYIFEQQLNIYKHNHTHVYITYTYNYSKSSIKYVRKCTCYLDPPTPPPFFAL